MSILAEAARFLWALIRGGRKCAWCGRFAPNPFVKNRLPFCNVACYQTRENLIVMRNTLEERARMNGALCFAFAVVFWGFLACCAILGGAI